MVWAGSARVDYKGNLDDESMEIKCAYIYINVVLVIVFRSKLNSIGLLVDHLVNSS